MKAFQKRFLALFALAGSLEVLGQVSSLCRPNERFMSCGGCQRSCGDPHPECDARCRVGCYCPDDLVRGVDGVCVQLSECPSNALHLEDALQPLDYAINTKYCPENEEYQLCEPCNRTCDNPNPICPAQCGRGCFCKDGLVRDRDGKCIPVNQCEKDEHSLHLEDALEPQPHNFSCPENEDYRFCEPCNRTCDNPNPICPAQCGRGCFCKDGLVRDRDGKCVKLQNCEKDDQSNFVKRESQAACDADEERAECAGCERSCSDPAPHCAAGADCARGCVCRSGLVRSPTGLCVPLEECPRAEESPPLHEQGVEDCAEDEEWLSCGWCEPTCSAPTPRCPPGCVRGCLCRPPLLRHHSGQCVPPESCQPRKCSGKNEEYACRYPCEKSCAHQPCDRRASRCSLGCYCRAGFLRHTTGECVLPEQCSARDQIKKLGPQH